MLTRRAFTGAATGAVGLGALAYLSRGPRAHAAAAAGSFPVQKSEAEWRRILTPTQFDVLRQEGTERPFTSPLLNEHRDGTFVCAGCDQPTYSSKTKFDSGTGWPSFWAAIDGGIGTTEDRSYGMLRTAVHCSRCGGHLGHVFDDGPQPTGKRHCMNGVALKFQPA